MPTLAVVSVENISDIKIQTPDIGIVGAGDIKSVLANYPTLAASLKAALKTHLDGLDHLAAAKRWKELSTKGIALPAPFVTAMNARIETLRAQRETALRAAITTPDPGPAPTAPILPPPDSTPEVIEAYQAALAAHQQALADWHVKANTRRTAVLRAKAKMDELIAAGVAITQSTQDAVNAVQPPAPPTPPVPPVPPDDGL